MKKLLACFVALALLSGCSDKSEEQANTADTAESIEAKQVSLTKLPNLDYAKKTYSFNKDSLTPGCEEDSEIICAINLTLKCTISPKLQECDKAKMPKFVFMEDESLEHPTEATYKITKMKPIADGQIEIYTESTCNAPWFGLCNGNVIYVLAQKNNAWTVKDIYARTSARSL